MASNKLYGPSPAPQTLGGVIPANTQGGVVAPLPLTQSIATTGETVILNPSILSQALVLAIPANSPLEQKEFELQLSGYLTTTQSATATLGMRIGTSTTAASNTAMATSGASAAIATTTVPFVFRARLIFDSVSGKLTGTVSGIIGATIVTAAAITGAPIAPSPAINNVNNPVLNFVPTVTFSAASTANTIHVQEWAINF